ncbi:MAG: hypothetical protein HC915_21030 [Anaerolineae bacterium]|nr:hypothetical protein [Anaerolineae bacterium]
MTGAVLTLGLDDPRYLMGLAEQAERLWVGHTSSATVATLGGRLRRYPHATVAEDVFPTEEAAFDRALIALPRGRELARALLWTALRALRPGGSVMAAGANDIGAKTVQKDAEALGAVFTLANKARHRVFSMQRPAKPATAG